jgi:hypothetical protein
MPKRKIIEVYSENYDGSRDLEEMERMLKEQIKKHPAWSVNKEGHIWVMAPKSKKRKKKKLRKSENETMEEYLKRVEIENDKLPKYN